MCLLTNERYITYQAGFSFGRLGHVPGVDLGVLGGWGQKLIFLQFNQTCCVSYSHEWLVQRHNCLVPAPWGFREGLKGQISFNINYKVNSKDFKQNFVCLLTNERYKTY